tara:strand:- start:7237 stop:8217 length:981 start_codon:yes stop_codon:yes gene_type:complete
MPTINFPSGPSLNDTYNLGVRTWKWNGDAWALQPLTGGFTGSQGYTGSAGSQGIQGVTGFSGSKGDQGVIGYSGSKGDTGSQGAIGYTGSAAPNTLSDLVDDTSPQLGGDLESNGNSIKLPDSATIFLGTSDDMQILHDGYSSVIKDVTGNQLYIQSTNFNLANSSGLKHIYANNDYGVTMYYQDSAKLETTGSGISVTGTVTATAFSGDGSALTGISSGAGSVVAWVNFNGSGTVAIRDSGNISSVTDNGTGDYLVNFSSNMPDNEYSAVASCKYTSSAVGQNVRLGSNSTYGNDVKVNQYRIQTTSDGNQSLADSIFVGSAVFR